MSTFVLPENLAQQLDMVVLGDVVAQQSERREVHPTLLQQLENHRETPRELRRPNPIEGLIFTEAQRLQAILEERAPSEQVQAACVDLGQMRDDARFSPRPSRYELS
jgi:hypothetical protein